MNSVEAKKQGTSPTMQEFVNRKAVPQQSSGFGNFMRGAAGGAIGGTGNIIGGIGQGLDWLGDKANSILPGNQAPRAGTSQGLAEMVTRPIQQYAQKGKEYFQNPATGYNTDAASGTLGNATGEILPQVAAMALLPESKTPEVGAATTEIGGYLGNLIAKGKAALNTAKSVKYAGPAIGLGADVTLGAASALPRSALSTSLSTLAASGKAPTLDELKAGGVIDAALGGISKAVPTVFRFGVNPEARGKQNWQEVEKRAQEAAGQYVGTKPMIFKQAENTIAVKGAQLDKIVSKVPTKYNVSSLTNGIVDAASKLEGTNKPVSDAMINYATEIEKKYAGKALSAKDILDIKRNVAETSSLFEGGVTDLGTAGRKQAADIVWENTDNIIDGIPGAKKLNRDMTVAYSVKGPVGAQLKQQPSVGIFSKVNSLPAVTPISTGLAAILKGASSTAGKQAVKNQYLNPLAGKIKDIGNNPVISQLQQILNMGKK